MHFGVLLIQALILAVSLLGVFSYMTWTERRLLARFQWRKGPNRVGPFGLLQPLADGIKLLFKEQLIPSEARTFVFLLAPCIALCIALFSFATIPITYQEFEVLGWKIQPALAPIGLGLMYVLAISSLGVYGIVLGGWSSSNKYSFIGGIRSSAQLISYELAMSSCLLGPIVAVGTLSFQELIAAQEGMFDWLVFSHPIAFILYCICGVAESNRTPFDLPEGEQELGGGFHTEYNGMRFALFFMAEYIVMMVVSAVAICVFLGGSLGPVKFPVDSTLGMALNAGPWWFILKMALFMFVFIWLRATFPRYRYDQLMRIGWQFIFPLGMACFFLSVVGVVCQWTKWGFLFANVLLIVVLYIIGKAVRYNQQFQEGNSVSGSV